MEDKSALAVSPDEITYKNKQKTRIRKRKRRSSSSDNEVILPDNTLETERNLHATAVRNNLDDVSMRKILKKVVTNDHVLALVKLQEEEEGDSGEDKSVQPKLTRAKAKELKKGSPRSAPWNLENLELTPINHIPVKTRPEVKALIAQELPDDEDDDEYEPTNDDVPSDDDHEHSCSDLDSQPRTPATPASQFTPSPKVLKDGPFKIPQDISSARRKLNVDEEEPTIAERTRSKLSLSTTTIEHIESSFVPPDDVQPPVDNLWSEFLSGCMDPAAPHEDDDDADPEYNAAADADAMDDDEDFLGSSLIKISKKELNDLVTELFNVMPATDDDLTLETLANSVLTDTSQTEVPRWEGKNEPISDDETTIRPSKRLKFEKENTITTSVGKSEPEKPRSQATNHVPCERIEPMHTRSLRSKEVKAWKENEKVLAPRPTLKPPEPIHIRIEERIGADENVVGAIPASLRSQIEPVTETMHIQLMTAVTFTQDQVLILQQQLRMHIQIATTSFLQLFVHPLHWQLAPVYKDYLETLEKLLKANKNSVVNVCNLTPALELVRNWAESVSKDTPENVEMVQFVNDQIEKCRRRYAQNCLYVGDFHDKLKELVSNSPVFLYPYLLPAVPFKADPVKRVFYLLPEDELIVLGLDQFWKYMDDNKDIYKVPKNVNSRHRWGLSTALQLVSKYMLPWITPKQLAAHVTNVRSIRVANDKYNPIYNYFTKNEVVPVQHSILPFNPELTLYDQPEHEMPRLWARYLARTSKRFKNFVRRRIHQTGEKPPGIPVAGVTEQTIIKKPLPLDFTKEIKCFRNPNDPLTDKEKTKNANEQNLNDVPLNMFRMVSTDKGTFLVPLEIVTIDGDNTGTVTTTNVQATTNTNVTTSTSTITTPQVTNKTPELPKPKLINKTGHCSCCILLRKMTKRQTVITDYFRKNKEKRKCYCENIKHPKVTNKLRLLANNFKNTSGVVFLELERRLEEVKSGKVRNERRELGNYTLDELVSVTTFQLKILSRSLMSKYSYLKVRCKNLLMQFNPDKDNPLDLANALFKTCGKELHDLYNDFLEFLTMEQVDKLNKFKDYFVRNCAKGLMDKVEEQVRDESARQRILAQLKHVFLDRTSSACEICSYLLESMAGYDSLAEYTFSLFPHWKAARIQEIKSIAPQTSPVAHIRIKGEDEPSGSESEYEDGMDESKMDDNQITTDCEADSSSRMQEINPIAPQTSPVAHIRIKGEDEPSGSESEYEDGMDESKMDDNQITTDCEADSSSSSEEPAETTEEHPNVVEDREMPMEIKTEPKSVIENEEDQKCTIEPLPQGTQSFIITLEEEIIKEEPVETTVWTRAEDKLILEMLNQLLTPEERKVKTVAEMLMEKNVVGLICEKMSHKSHNEVRERVLCILSMLVLSES